MGVLGGLGVIHKNMDTERQVKTVKRVKHYLNGRRIDSPITVPPHMTLEEIETMCTEKRFEFRTFPVIDENGKMLGMLSGSDIDFVRATNYSRVTAADAMTPLTRGFLRGKPDTTPEQALTAMRKAKKKVMPLVDRGRLVGMYLFSDLERVFSSSAPHNVDTNGQLTAAAAIGAGKSAIGRTEQLVPEAHCDVLHIDTAHGDSENVLWTIRELKKLFPYTDVVAGNVSHHHAVERLIEAGADGIMVGQGPGSICTTRTLAGIGCPQVTALYRCVKAAEKHDVPVCADGGIEHPGDITIALAVGASSVMIGSRLAGTDVSPGEKVTHNGREWKHYRGMGSLSAMLDRKESRARYSQEGIAVKKLVPEGVEGMVPYKGPLSGVINELAGGPRAGMGYIGAATILELQKKAKMLRITGAGLAESNPHGILLTA